MGILLVCMYVQHLHTWCHQKPEKDFRFPGTGVTIRCEPPCAYWKPNPSPLNEQPVLKNTDASLKLNMLTHFKEWDHIMIIP